MLIETVTRIQHRLLADYYRNEAAIRQGILLPLIRACGWPDDDTRIVQPEFPVVGDFIDLMLHCPGPDIAIELKAYNPDRPELTSAAKKQLCGYMLIQPVRLAILTNGRHWSFYLPDNGKFTEAGIVSDEQRVDCLDLQTDEIESSAAVLTEYLDFAVLSAGKRFSNACETVKRERPKFGSGPRRIDSVSLESSDPQGARSTAQVGTIQSYELPQASAPIDPWEKVAKGSRKEARHG